MSAYSEKELDKKLAMTSGRNCDKYDYLIAVGSGAIAGLVDIFLVGAPGSSVLGTWTDAQVDHVVETFARFTGWKGDGIASAIGYLEKKFPVNYDQKNTSDVDGAFRMGTRNHHLKSLSHSPDPIGLFFSILDQFQGKSSFIADGKIVRIDAGEFELRGDSFHEKVFFGFCNWLGHIMSDIAGSSGGRSSGGGRGSGIAIPFYELFQFADVGSFQIGKDRQSFAVLMTRVFQEGYDARFGLTMAIPVVMTDLFIRAAWALKQHFYHGRPWEECIPGSQNPDLRWMLLVGNATLCMFDGADALVRSGGNPVLFVMRLNIVAWFKLVLMIFKELMIRYSFTYTDLKHQFERINAALDEYLARLKSIDYGKYEQELKEIQAIQVILADEHAEIGQIYQYLLDQGADMQFCSFEEFDQRMQEEDFVLRI